MGSSEATSKEVKDEAAKKAGQGKEKAKEAYSEAKKASGSL